MKKAKQFLSLALVLLMLVGMPMSVSAVGTTTPEELKLIGAMPITSDMLPDSKVHTDTSWADKALMLYFNRATSINPSGTNVYGRIVIVDSTTNNVVSVNGTNLIWNASRKTSAITGGSTLYGLNGYFMYITNTVTIDGASVGTWTEIYKYLAKHPTYKLQLRVCEYGVAKDDDTLVGNICANDDTTVKLKANLQVNSGGTPTTSGTVDCACIDICTLSETATVLNGVVTLNSVTMVSNQNMELHFSEPVTIDASRNTAMLEVVNADGTSINTYGVTLPTAASGETITARLSANCWTNIRNALANAGAGSYVRFKMTEKNLVTAQGEQTSNYVVDTVWGTENDKPLRSSITATGSADYVLCNVTEDIPDPKVLSAVVQDANADTVDILVTFNKPVTVNAKNNDVWMRFGSYSSATAQQQMTDKTYITPVTINDVEYSNQIRFTFKANSQPLAANVGILFAEYNYHNGTAHEDYQVDSCVIADENGVGLFPSNVTSCSDESCTNKKISLSYTKAMLAEDAQKIVSVSRVDATTVTVNFAMNVTAINTAGITLGGRMVTAANDSAGTWTLTLDSELTSADAVLTIPASAVTTGYNGQVIAKEMTATLSLTDRLAAAKENDTVSLTANETVDTLNVPTGVTVDLNGHILTATKVYAIIGNAHIIDSASEKGGIKIDKNVKATNSEDGGVYNLTLSRDNKMLPLYDQNNGCYRFYDCIMTHMADANEKGKGYRFGFQMVMDAAAYQLLATGNADIDLITDLVIDVDDGTKTANVPGYTFNADTLAKYGTNKQTQPETNWAVILRVSGFDKVEFNDSIIVTSSDPHIESSTGVIVSANQTSLTFTKSE